MGIAPEQFWRYTPAELLRAFAGARAAREHEDRRAVMAGWIGAYCQRVKRFPTLQSLMDKRGQRGQTAEQQYAVMEAIMMRQNRMKK